ncbi:hypothetical protein, partial [uncultured Desulfovibrio sp.]|uniref:hypothetical protein n=1 Tax=uncultured Desulfovibrio sp. TaxID=167968 RepID=UPI00260E7C1E
KRGSFPLKLPHPPQNPRIERFTFEKGRGLRKPAGAFLPVIRPVGKPVGEPPFPAAWQNGGSPCHWRAVMPRRNKISGPPLHDVAISW